MDSTRTSVPVSSTSVTGSRGACGPGSLAVVAGSGPSIAVPVVASAVGTAATAATVASVPAVASVESAPPQPARSAAEIAIALQHRCGLVIVRE